MHPTRRFPALPAAALLMTALAAHAAESPLHVCIDENPWPPYSFLQETAPGAPPVLKGFTVDLATTALQSLGQGFTIARLPWAEVHRRARSTTADERCDMVWDISATPEREEYLYFTDPIYKLHYTLMYTQIRFPRSAPIRQMTDLKGWKTCGVKDYNYGNLPAQLTLQRADSIQDALNKLQRKECDFLLIEASVMERGKTMGLYKSAPLGCVELGGMSKSYRLAVSRQADNATVLYANLKKILDRLRRGGIQADLARQYRVATPDCREKLD